MNGEERRYAQSHEWVLEGDGIATVGITDYAIQQLGDIVYLELPPVGTALVAGERLGDIESVKAVSEIYAPVSGEVIEINEALHSQPEIVNEFPMSNGWMVKVQLSKPDEVGQLMDREAYDAFVTEQA